MKKNKFFILLILLISFVGLTINCTHDMWDYNYKPDEKGLIVKKIEYNKLKENSFLQKKLGKIKQSFDFNKQILQRNIDSDDGTFTILTNKILETITDSTHTYTFAIEKTDCDMSHFKNFVIYEIDTTYQFFLYNYTLSNNDEYYPEIISIDDTNIDLNEFDEYLNKLVVVQDDCTYTYIEYCVDGYVANPECGCDNPWVYDPCAGTVNVLVDTYCGDEDSGGGSNSSQSSDDNQNGGDTAGDQGNSNNSSQQNNDNFAPTAVLPPDPDCEKLKNGLSTPISVPGQTIKINDLLISLNQSIDSTREIGYTGTMLSGNDILNATYVEGDVGTIDDFPIIYNGFIFMVVHTHFDTKTQLPVFSLSDIQSIYKIIQEGTFYDTNNITAYLVTEYGTKYALQFNEDSFTNSSLSTYFDGWEYDTIKRPLNKIFSDNYKIKPRKNLIKSIQKNEKNFVKFLADFHIEANLFKANDDFSQWTKVIYENNEIKETNCN